MTFLSDTWPVVILTILSKILLEKQNWCKIAHYRVYYFTDRLLGCNRSPSHWIILFNLMRYSVHFFRSPCLNTKATATTAFFPGLHLFFNWHGKLSVIKVFAGFHGHRWQLFRDFHLKKCKENIRWDEIISEVKFAFSYVCLIIWLDAVIEGWMSIPVWI